MPRRRWDSFIGEETFEGISATICHKSISTCDCIHAFIAALSANAGFTRSNSVSSIAILYVHISSILSFSATKVGVFVLSTKFFGNYLTLTLTLTLTVTLYPKHPQQQCYVLPPLRSRKSFWLSDSPKQYS